MHDTVPLLVVLSSHKVVSCDEHKSKLMYLVISIFLEADRRIHLKLVDCAQRSNKQTRGSSKRLISLK